MKGVRRLMEASMEAFKWWMSGPTLDEMMNWRTWPPLEWRESRGTISRNYRRGLRCFRTEICFCYLQLARDEDGFVFWDFLGIDLLLCCFWSIELHNQNVRVDKSVLLPQESSFWMVLKKSYTHFLKLCQKLQHFQSTNPRRILITSRDDSHTWEHTH